MYNKFVGIVFSTFIIFNEVNFVALSQDFEARRRERLKKQHEKREKMRKIRHLIVILAFIAIIIIVITNIVRCASKPKEVVPATSTTAPYQSTQLKESSFDPSIPEPKEGANDWLDVIKNSGQTKHVYLTFDEGPSDTVTPEILDVLRKYNVKATFFMTGDDIKDYPYLCTRAMEEGHLVLPLSLSGDPDTLYADKTTFIDEVEETYDLIVKNSPSTEKPIKLYRFLGGGYANTSYGDEKQELKDVLAKNGFYFCDWNTTIGDSNTARTAEQLVNFFTSAIPQLNNLIVQMHNTDKNGATADALPKIIETLLDEGYTFNRLDEIDFANSSDNNEEDENEDSDATDEPQDSDNDSEAQATEKTTEKTTTKPESKTASPATEKPASTSSPTARPVVTEPPRTATLAPSGNNNEIESE